MREKFSFSANSLILRGLKTFLFFSLLFFFALLFFPPIFAAQMRAARPHGRFPDPNIEMSPFLSLAMSAL